MREIDYAGADSDSDVPNKYVDCLTDVAMLDGINQFSDEEWWDDGNNGDAYDAARNYDQAPRRHVTDSQKGNSLSEGAKRFGERVATLQH